MTEWIERRRPAYLYRRALSPMKANCAVATSTVHKLAVIMPLMLSLAACVTRPPAPAPAVPAPTSPGDIASIPDAVPRVEPLSTKGNPAFYDVMGQRYYVMNSASGYIERGVASWYGPGFHKEFTSNGEPYDMYGMTAAHKTLPLPTYVQVTNLTNGKSVVVRVNDRGPFKTGRIIDLSYTAASKLDMVRAGTALVEVRALTPGDNIPAPALVQQSFVQAGAFSNSTNADKLATQLRTQGYSQVLVRNDDVNGRSLYRVRIGPVADAGDFDRIVTELKKLGINDARLANE
jgi:rare lipoprotein A